MLEREAPQGARRPRREQRREETRAELIAAAGRVFARRGFHGASIQEIAREAGYSTGAIYWHFSGKEDLYLATYESYKASQARELDEIPEPETVGIRARARKRADWWIERVKGEPDPFILSIEFLVHAWRHPAFREAFAQRVAGGRLAVERVLREDAEAAGLSLPLSAEDLAAVLNALGTGLALAKLTDPDAVRDELFGDFVALLFELIEGSPRNDVSGLGSKAERTD